MKVTVFKKFKEDEVYENIDTLYVEKKNVAFDFDSLTLFRDGSYFVINLEDEKIFSVKVEEE